MILFGTAIVCLFENTNILSTILNNLDIYIAICVAVILICLSALLADKEEER